MIGSENRSGGGSLIWTPAGDNCASTVADCPICTQNWPSSRGRFCQDGDRGHHDRTHGRPETVAGVAFKVGNGLPMAQAGGLGRFRLRPASADPPVPDGQIDPRAGTVFLTAHRGLRCRHWGGITVFQKTTSVANTAPVVKAQIWRRGATGLAGVTGILQQLRLNGEGFATRLPRSTSQDRSIGGRLKTIGQKRKDRGS